MKVLMQLRTDAFEKFGGDTIQMLQYKNNLRCLGIDVDISLDIRPDLSDVNVVHLFNIDRPLETYTQMRHAKASGRPVVLSSIHHPLRYVEYYERHCRDGLLSLLNRLIPSRSAYECSKDLVRIICGQAPFCAWWIEFRKGQKRLQQEILCEVDAVCLLAEAEGQEIAEDFGVVPLYTQVIHNGCSEPQEEVTLPEYLAQQIRGIGDFVLVAGRIEARKNQIGIVKALCGTEVPVVFVGDMNRWQSRYSRQFLRLIADDPNMIYLGRVEPQYMSALYSKAKVHLLASWYEVSPLVDLEAACWGCHVLTTARGYAEEYASDFAKFIDPADPVAMRNAVISAMSQARPLPQHKWIVARFSWRKAAEKLVMLYEALTIQRHDDFGMRGSLIN